MAWFLITAGLILITISIYEKVSIYKEQMNKLGNQDDYISRNNIIQSEVESDIITDKLDKVVKNQSYSSSREVNQKLEEVIKMVDSTREEIINKINKNNLEEGSSIKRETDFQKIFQKKYNDSENKNKNLPKKYQKVFKMADKGENAEEIAEKLNLGIRETRLILKLYEKEQKKDSKGQMLNVP